MLGGGAASSVTGVSNDGQVIVTSEFYHGNSEAVLWSWKPTLHATAIPGFFDFNCCYPSQTANAINNFSHVVGDSTLSRFIGSSQDFIEGDHAYLYANGKLTDLGVLGNPNPAGSLGQSAAYGLNNHDEVVGESDIDLLSTNPDCLGCVVSHAFLWRRGKMTDLGNLGHVPHWTSIATAINDAGEIVGSADANVANKPITRAFVYLHGTLYNLTFRVHHRDLNVRLVQAVDINCHGWIVANGYNIADPTVNRVYLLVPEDAPRRPGCERLKHDSDDAAGSEID
jgi:probable HAF family extracellular repeat protein